MKEYKSKKYIKMNAKIGSSRSNSVKPVKIEPKKVKRANSSCGGCSRRAR